MRYFFVLSFFVLQPAMAMIWPWPMNGKVINYSILPVAVWDGEHGIYTLAAGTFSGKQADIDHIFDFGSFRWCKIGPNTVIVNRKGEVESCPKWVSGPGAAS
ncbi:hypothetical protein [Deefgea salmonis]|uniref:Uncharacterized protein n=1 Tax=Deefgea salmonis TaxID=2875502 RepID=A0ABS8BJ27_9NEIS|nr:hypothetical protein [Deefgea salmonis]MCB5195730.1 hypothetical protein [Deefgea salmonis]